MTKDTIQTALRAAAKAVAVACAAWLVWDNVIYGRRTEVMFSTDGFGRTELFINDQKLPDDHKSYWLVVLQTGHSYTIEARVDGKTVHRNENYRPWLGTMYHIPTIIPESHQ